MRRPAGRALKTPSPLWLLLLTAGCQLDNPWVVASQRQPILGGDETKVGDSPQTVAVLALGGLCTGTLISPDTVLTAAHCVDFQQLGAGSQAQVTADTVVVFDSNDLFRQIPGAFAVEAADTRPKPEYQPNLFGDDDVGIVKLATPVNDRLPIAIDADPARNLVGENVIQMGYGVADDGGAGVEFTLFAKEIASCGFIGGSNADLLCYDQTDGSGKCNGDSGGPSFFCVGNVPTVVGVTSFGDQGCQQFGADSRVTGNDELAFITDNAFGVGVAAPCAANGQCEANCGQGGRAVDPDCGAQLACATDGLCELCCGADGLSSLDPDCGGGILCVADDACQVGCGERDPDCVKGKAVEAACAVSGGSSQAPLALFALSLLALALLRRRRWGL
jgi:MYXO-CTERM domain-containing protein